MPRIGTMWHEDAAPLIASDEWIGDRDLFDSLELATLVRLEDLLDSLEAQDLPSAWSLVPTTHSQIVRRVRELDAEIANRFDYVLLNYPPHDHNHDGDRDSLDRAHAHTVGPDRVLKIQPLRRRTTVAALSLIAAYLACPIAPGRPSIVELLTPGADPGAAIASIRERYEMLDESVELAVFETVACLHARLMVTNHEAIAQGDGNAAGCTFCPAQMDIEAAIVEDIAQRRVREKRRRKAWERAMASARRHYGDHELHRPLEKPWHPRPPEHWRTDNQDEWRGELAATLRDLRRRGILDEREGQWQIAM